MKKQDLIIFILYMILALLAFIAGRTL